MAAISDAAPASFSGRAHLLALRRSIVVAAAGIAIWIALIGSSSSHPGREMQSTDTGAPSWTYRGASAVDVRPPSSPQARYSCLLY